MAKNICFNNIIFILFSANAVFAADTDSSTQRIREITDLRETNSKTYEMSDGSYQCVVYAQDVHYAAPNGTMREIDNAITTSVSKSGYSYKNTENSWYAYFADKLTQNNAVSMEKDGYSVSFSLPSPDASSGGALIDRPLSGQSSAKNAQIAADMSDIEIADNPIYASMAEDDRVVLYKDALPNADISYTVKTGALKEDIILKSPAAPHEIVFDLNTTGLTPDETDGITVFKNSDGDTIFELAPLYMEDAEGKRSEDVTHKLESENGKYRIVITADEAFLNDPDTVYPVIIDPSVMVTGSSDTHDTCVDQQYPTSNYYLSENLWTGGKLGTNAMRTYIQFDLPTNLSNTQITSVYLRIKKREHLAPTVKAYRVTTSWASKSITWNNKPTFTTTGATGAITLDTGAWYKINATTMVKNWRIGTYPNYGFVLKEPSETTSTQKTKFYSSDAPSPNKPELVINYTNPPSGPGISSIGGLGVNDYTNCEHVSRAGRSLVQKLSGRMPVSINKEYLYYDANAYPSRFLNARKVDLFVYSGHGVAKRNYKAPHFYASSASKPSHTSSEDSDTVFRPFEASSKYIRFNHKYVAMYTCNWLTWNGATQRTNCFSTFASGCRQQLGFASRMFLDSREGNMFGYRMIDYAEPIKTAFFESAKSYQKQSDENVIARVATWNSASNDTFYSGASGLAPGYSGNTSQYSCYTITVTGTGIHF